MHFVFGLRLDGLAWPGALGEREAVAGERWGGPVTLLTTLEGQLGLAGPTPTAALRAAQLIPLLATDGAFWSESVKADPFSTALELIHWDEQLRLHGWRGEGVSERLGRLAELLDTVPHGFGQRFDRVLRLLPDQGIDLEVLEVVDHDRHELPVLYQRVLVGLEEAGCRVAQRRMPDVERSGDLAHCLCDGFDPKGTGELQLIRPAGPLDAADAVGVWLRSQAALDGTVIIGGDEILGTALHRHGLPTVGGRAIQGANSLLHVLPLIIELGWWPVDPAVALDLLTLPDSPVPLGVARRLDRALREWPAVGGDAWDTALDDALQAIEDEQRRERVAHRLNCECSRILRVSGSR